MSGHFTARKRAKNPQFPNALSEHIRCPGSHRRLKSQPSDIMLPDEDGLEIVRKLRAIAGTRGIPVIMVTAKASEIAVFVFRNLQ